MIAGRKRGYASLSTKQGTWVHWLFRKLLFSVTEKHIFQCWMTCNVLCLCWYLDFVLVMSGARIVISVLCMPLVAGYVRPPLLGLPDVDEANISCKPAGPHLVCVLPPPLSSSFCIPVNSWVFTIRYSSLIEFVFYRSLGCLRNFISVK